MNYKVSSKISAKVIASNVKLADTFFSRLKGLMFTENMDGYDGLIIKPCNSIHTFFMKYPIDVIFMDQKNRIVKIKKNIKPWRATPIYFGATQVLEMQGGTLSDELKVGEELEVLCTS